MRVSIYFWGGGVPCHMASAMAQKKYRCGILETLDSAGHRTSFVGAVTKQKLTPVAAEDDMDMPCSLGNFLPFPGHCKSARATNTRSNSTQATTHAPEHATTHAHRHATTQTDKTMVETRIQGGTLHFWS